MLVCRLHGSLAGQILDLEDWDARMRVENGNCRFLTEGELDDDTVLARIGKVPEQTEASVPVLIDTNNPPPGYKVVQDEKPWPRAFYAYTPRGHLIRFKPLPSRAASYGRTWVTTV